jgi:hypothetical protein
MEFVIADALADALGEAIVSIARWAATTEVSPSKRRTAREASEISYWLDTYKLVRSRSFHSFTEPPSGVSVPEMRKILLSSEIQSALHELLAIRLTGGSESDISKIKVSFIATLHRKEPKLKSNRLNIAYCSSIFNYYNSQILDLVKSLGRTGSRKLDSVRVNAYNARILAILNVIESHVNALINQIDPEEERQYLTKYRRHLSAMHGSLTPPDLDRRRRIPISEIYVSPRMMDENALMLTLAQFTTSIDRNVLLGHPGSGKTTAATVITYNLASGIQRVPFLIILRDFASEDPPRRSVAKYIEHRLETLYQCPPPPRLVEQLLISGRATVIFDGLDELLDSSKRVAVTEIIEQFCLEYPHTAVLVTSRIIGYEQAALDANQFSLHRLADFTDDEVAEYVAKWFLQDHEIESGKVPELTSEFMRESLSVPDLRTNPLMLALICLLYHGEGYIPSNRPEVYQQCAELLFRKWDARRRIKTELKAHALIEAALRHLALWIMESYAPQFLVTERNLVVETARFLRRGFEMEEEANDAAAEFIEFCKGRAWVFSDAGTTRTGESLYTFTHRTFLEYFAASYLAVSADTPEGLARLLLPHIANQEWEVVSELALQKKGQISDLGSERAVTQLLEESVTQDVIKRSNILRFLSRCLSSMKTSPSTVRDVARSDLAHLLSGSVNDEIYYAPLTYLLSISPERRSSVRDEVEKWAFNVVRRLDDATGASSKEMAASALLVLAHIDSGVRSDQFSPKDSVPYWREVAKEATRNYVSQIRQLALSDDRIADLALFSDIRHLGETRTLDIERCFAAPQMSVFGHHYDPFFFFALGRLVSEDPVPRTIQDSFDAFGKAALPSQRPWNIELADRRSISFTGLHGIWMTQLTDYGRFGVLLTAAILAEHGALSRTFTGEVPSFRPYWTSRVTPDSNDRLPDLPIPRKCMDELKLWARGAVSFASSGAIRLANENRRNTSYSVSDDYYVERDW